MGVLQRFERRLEGLVNGAFAKAFKSEVQPVEIASSLQRECDDRAATVGRGRTMVPNDFIVELGEHDYERLATSYAAPLAAELAGLVEEHGREQRYMFVGPVEVKFERALDLATGMFRIRSQALAGVVQMPGGPDGMPVPGPGPQGGGMPPMDGMGGAPNAPYPPYGAAAGPAPGFPSPPMAPMPSAPPPMQSAYPPPPGMGGGPGMGAPNYWVEVNGVRHPLARPVTSMGRGTDVDLRVDDPSVSRRHAEIRLGNPTVITDLGSTNGIVVDDQHVRQAQLRDGSVIHLGNTTIVFRQA